jgi:hypothetical protein
MKRIIAAVVAVVGLAVLPAGAVAKEANVTISGFPAGGLSAGDKWNPTVYVTIDRQPVEPAQWTGGQMPRPQVVAIEKTTGKRLTYTLQPTGKPGYFSGTVVFPNSGTWRYELDSHYSDRVYQYRPVTIAPSGGGWSVPAIGGGVALALVAATGAFLLWRRRGARPGAPTVVRPV